MSKAEQDKHARAKKRFEDACDVWADQHKRMREDLEFSNPADPQQWAEEARELRKGRVMLTLDRTNQYIVQVVNDARKNKPGITTMPADSKGDPAVAQALDGIFRHIEYRSRAPIAYDTAIDHSARVGLGWLRVVPEVIRSDTNEQEICIKRVHDMLSVMTLGGTEPDGSDITDAFVVTRMTKAEFERAYPKAGASSWTADGRWFFEDEVTICEWFYIEEKESSHIRTENDDGEGFTLSEDDYWELARKVGYAPKVVETFTVKTHDLLVCEVECIPASLALDFGAIGQRIDDPPDFRRDLLKRACLQLRQELPPGQYAGHIPAGSRRRFGNSQEQAGRAGLLVGSAQFQFGGSVERDAPERLRARPSFARSRRHEPADRRNRPRRLAQQ